MSHLNLRTMTVPASVSVSIFNNGLELTASETSCPAPLPQSLSVLSSSFLHAYTLACMLLHTASQDAALTQCCDSHWPYRPLSH